MTERTSENWRKSSRSNGQANCVEIGNWRKSSRSNGERECVEVGGHAEILVRDTKLGEKSPVLVVTPAAWSAFIASLVR